MAANSLLNLTPLRSPDPEDRQQLLQAVKQHIIALQRSFLHQRQLQSRRRLTAAGPAQSPVSLRYQIWSLQYGGQSARKLDSGEAVTAFFQQEGVDGRLLILGEPGTGKSQTLCTLGSRLLAKLRPGDPVPVLLDLSGWQGQDLRPWIIHQLWRQYRVARRYAQVWLETGELTLLLDGFDGLPSPRQRTCAQGIDTLMRSNLNQTIALCCQRQTLERTGINFSYFNSGVHIIPLGAQQVKDYVTGLNRPDLWKGIKASKPLQHLARFPLMLNLLTENYDGTAAANRSDLVQRYVDGQLPADQSPALHRLLGWLAQQLEQRQRVFALDALNPTWLPDSQRLLYRLLLTLAMGGMIWALSGSPLLGLALGIMAAQVDVDRLAHFHLSLASLRGQAWLRVVATGLLLAVILAIPLGAAGGLVSARFGQGATAALYGAAAGITLGFWGGLWAQCWGGLPQVIQFRQRVNQDTLSALQNGILLVVIYAALLGATVALVALLSGQPFGSLVDPQGLRYLLAIATGLVLWISHSLQQLILRIVLSLGSGGAVPLNLTSQLNAAVERKLLRRVGGSYSFIHDQIRQQFVGTNV